MYRQVQRSVACVNEKDEDTILELNDGDVLADYIMAVK